MTWEYLWLALGLAAAGGALYFWWVPIFGIWDRLPGGFRALIVAGAAAAGAWLVGRGQGKKLEAERQRQRQARATEAANAQRDAKTEEVNSLPKDELERRAGRWVER